LTTNIVESDFRYTQSFSYANAGNVDSVFIAGNVRKWRGKLVGQDLKKIREKAHQSRDYLFACLGYKLDILA